MGTISEPADDQWPNLGVGFAEHLVNLKMKPFGGKITKRETIGSLLTLIFMHIGIPLDHATVIRNQNYMDASSDIRTVAQGRCLWSFRDASGTHLLQYLCGRLRIFRASLLDLSSIHTCFSSATWLTYLAEVPCPKPPEQLHSPSKISLTSHTSRTFPCTIMATSSTLLWMHFTPSGRECHSATMLREGVCTNDLHQLQDPHTSDRTTQTTILMRISSHLSISYLLTFLFYFWTIRIYV